MPGRVGGDGGGNTRMALAIGLVGSPTSSPTGETVRRRSPPVKAQQPQLWPESSPVMGCWSLEEPPAVASWRHRVGCLVTPRPPCGGSLTSPNTVVGRRISGSGDYGEALLLPATTGNGEPRLKKADRAGGALDSPGVAGGAPAISLH